MPAPAIASGTAVKATRRHLLPPQAGFFAGFDDLGAWDPVDLVCSLETGLKRRTLVSPEQARLAPTGPKSCQGRRGEIGLRPMAFPGMFDATRFAGNVSLSPWYTAIFWIKNLPNNIWV